MSWNILGLNIGGALEGAINNAANASFKAGIKYIWSEVKLLAPYQWEMNKAYIQSFRRFYPDKIKTIFGRFEIGEINVSELTKTLIDPSGGFSIKTNGNLEVQAVKGNAPITFDINRGSVYGIAKYKGEWKGARVEK